VRRPRPRAESASTCQPNSGGAEPPRPSGRAAWARLVALVALVAILAAAGVTAAVVGLPDAQQIRVRSTAAGPAAPYCSGCSTRW